MRNRRDSEEAPGDTRPGERRPPRGSQTGLVTSHQTNSVPRPVRFRQRERAKDFERGEVEVIASKVVLPRHSESDEAEAAAWDGVDREVVGHKSVALEVAVVSASVNALPRAPVV